MTKTVVIVDDSMFQIQQLSRYFKDVLGFTICGTGENGEEAINLYRQHLPDLLTMDLTMPTLDGRGALLQILEEFPKAKILVISAVKGPLLLDCLALGGDISVLATFSSLESSQASRDETKFRISALAETTSLRASSLLRSGNIRFPRRRMESVSIIRKERICEAGEKANWESTMGESTIIRFSDFTGTPA